MKNQKVIEQLGYTSKEAKVYLASLSLGESHISDIAAKVKIPRSTAQAIVDRLHEDGLMNFYIMRRYKYWVAENPERLLEKLKKREEAIAEALPKLSAIREASRNNNINKDPFYLKSLSMIKTYSEASSQPTLITNSDIEIVYVNTAWQKEFGYSLEEMLGEHPPFLKSGKTPQSEYDRMWKILKDDALFQSDKIIDRRKDGTYFTLRTTIFQVRHGNRKFYIQILNDATEKDCAKEMQDAYTDLNADT